MRKRIFRGKRLDNGEWVLSGSIIRFNPENGEELFYIPSAHDACTCVHDADGNILSFEKGTFYKVDPESVGEFAGQTDCCGDNMFDGDIVYYEAEDINGVIQWDDDTSLFAICFDGWMTDFDHMYGHELMVIGNIHDNPELLSGKEGDL